MAARNPTINEDPPDEREGVAPWMRNIRRRLADNNIPTPYEPHWLRARWEANLTVDQTFAILQLLHTEHSALEADTHVRLADRRDNDGLQVLECSCGTASLADSFSRDEATGWWTRHQNDVEAHSHRDV